MTGASPLDDPAGFVRENTRLLPVRLVPEIVLHLADEAIALWEKTEAEIGEIGLPPPYWAFAWAGGQALARFLIDHPAHVAGKSVVDFASGSGLVAIAAAKAGARRVVATDIDPIGCAAMALNATANGVTLQIEKSDITSNEAGRFDVITAGDVFYEADMADAATLWLLRERAAGTAILIGDPGRSYFPHERLEKCAEYRVSVTRALEDTEFKQSAVWAFRPPS